MKEIVDYIIYLDFSKKTKLGKFIFENEIYQENDYCSGVLNVTNFININFLPRIGDTFLLDDRLYGDNNLLDLIIKKDFTKRDIMLDLYFKVKDVEHFCYEDSENSENKKLHVINILLCLPKKNKHKI